MSRYIKVKVNPKARLNKVHEESDGSYTVWTTAPPDKGAANDSVLRALADHLGLPRRMLSLKTGATSRQKLFEITDEP